MPWVTLGMLLVLCAVHGLATVHGLSRPADVDSLRDVGLVQGILDGNWFGDPIYAEEWRWYPPLIPALGAIAALVSGVPPMTSWVQAGPWLNLMAPLVLFLMTRRLFDSAPAAAATTAVYVLLNGALAYPWIAGGYTPWPFIPNISQAFFFLTVWLIHARVTATMRARDSLLIGLAIGLAFLAHPVPAVILTAIVTTTTFAMLGFRLRTFALLAGVAVAELAVMSPYLAPILAHYPRGIVNTAPGSYLDPLLRPPELAGTALQCAPGLASAVVVWLLRRSAPLGRATAVILATWIGMCAILFLRYFGCDALGNEPFACRVFVVPAHHYFLSLQAAWACLIGYAAWQAARRWLVYDREISQYRAACAAGVGVVLFAIGGTALLHRDFDANSRAAAQVDGELFDRAAYEWIRANTRPTGLFITPFADDWTDRVAFAVIAAGRRLVAAPEFHSSPFVDWHERDARRRRYIAAATGAGPERDLCELAGSGAWLLMPNAEAVAPGRAEPVFRTDYNTIYRITATGCPVAS